MLRSDKRGEQAPVFAAVGPMQFEVAAHRMAAELSAPIALESLPYQVARIVDPEDADFVNRQPSAEVLTRTDGVMLRSTSAADRRSANSPDPHPRREDNVTGGSRRENSTQ